MKKIFKIKFLLLASLFFSLSTFAQISISTLTGTEGIIGLRAGYHLNENWELGAKYNPPLNILAKQGTAGFIGGYVKYNFAEMEGMFNTSMVPYLIGNFGQITPPADSGYNSISSSGISSVSINYKPITGGSVGAGFEVGSKSLKYITEIGFGRMPNLFSSLFSTDPYSSTTKDADTAKAFTSVYYVSFGLVYNFE